MKKIKDPMHAKIVVRPSHPALKIAVTVLIVFSMAAMIALWWVHDAIAEETESLRDQTSALEHSNAQMEQRMKDPDSIQNLKDIAKEELGLVDPDTVIIEPKLSRSK